MIIKSPANKKEYHRVVIAFVDDSDFVTMGDRMEKNLKDMTKAHVRLHEVTGGKA